MGTNNLIPGPVTQYLITHLIEKMGESTDIGAHSLFLGQVRADEIDGKKVIAIEYSAYEELVKHEVTKIKEAILSEFRDVKTIDIVHSTGVIRTGENSLLVMVSASHRHQAMLACSKTVELIKERLPIWKKEIFDDNSHRWNQNIPV